MAAAPHASRSQKVRQVSPYSRPNRLRNLDGRTIEGRKLRTVRDELIAHVGGEPSAVQLAMIDRAAMLSLHVAQLDAKINKAGGVFTEHDSRTYLAWSNSLRIILRDLGIEAAPARVLTPNEHFARKNAAAAAA